MKERWIRLQFHHDGDLKGVEVYTRQEVIRNLLHRAPQERGAFTNRDQDYGDTVTIKKAVAAVGGAAQLAYLLKVNRVLIYQWAKRASIPSRHRDAVTGYADGTLDPGEAVCEG